MATSLSELSVGSYLQMVGATASFLADGAKHCAEQGVAADAIVATQLHPDMLPFEFQVNSVVHHSVGAIKALSTGEFGPPSGFEDTDYAGLQARVNAALTELQGLDTAAIDALAGGQVTFKMGDNAIPFTTENFVMSFSLPNLYFHATTAYDILRMQGVPLGKLNFLGSIRMGV